MIEILYEEALNNMANSFEVLTKQLGAPDKVTINGSYTHRYKEESIYVAIVLMLDRVITGLQAIFHLYRLGFIQEQAALHRIADELA